MNIDVKSNSLLKPCWSPLMTVGDDENSSVGVIRPGERLLSGDGELWYASNVVGAFGSIVMFPADADVLTDDVSASEGVVVDCGCSINGLVAGWPSLAKGCDGSGDDEEFEAVVSKVPSFSVVRGWARECHLSTSGVAPCCTQRGCGLFLSCS